MAISSLKICSAFLLFHDIVFYCFSLQSLIINCAIAINFKVAIKDLGYEIKKHEKLTLDQLKAALSLVITIFKKY